MFEIEGQRTPDSEYDAGSAAKTGRALCVRHAPPHWLWRGEGPLRVLRPVATRFSKTKGTRVRFSLLNSLMFGRVPGTRPNIREFNSEKRTRVPFCIERGRLIALKPMYGASVSTIRRSSGTTRPCHRTAHAARSAFRVVDVWSSSSGAAAGPRVPLSTLEYPFVWGKGVLNGGTQGYSRVRRPAA